MSYENHISRKELADRLADVHRVYLANGDNETDMSHGAEVVKGSGSYDFLMVRCQDGAYAARLI